MRPVGTAKARDTGNFKIITRQSLAFQLPTTVGAVARFGLQNAKHSSWLHSYHGHVCMTRPFPRERGVIGEIPTDLRIRDFIVRSMFVRTTARVDSLKYETL